MEVWVYGGMEVWVYGGMGAVMVCIGWMQGSGLGGSASRPISSLWLMISHSSLQVKIQCPHHSSAEAAHSLWSAL